MKKVVFAVSVISLLSLLIPSVIIAEPTHPNEVGLYLNDDGTGATGTYEIGTFVDVYLVLTKPSDEENNNEPYPIVTLFQCTLSFNPAPQNDLFVMNAVLPPTPF